MKTRLFPLAGAALAWLGTFAAAGCDNEYDPRIVVSQASVVLGTVPIFADAPTAELRVRNGGTYSTPVDVEVDAPFELGPSTCRELLQPGQECSFAIRLPTDLAVTGDGKARIVDGDDVLADVSLHGQVFASLEIELQSRTGRPLESDPPGLTCAEGACVGAFSAPSVRLISPAGEIAHWPTTCTPEPIEGACAFAMNDNRTEQVRTEDGVAWQRPFGESVRIASFPGGGAVVGDPFSVRRVDVDGSTLWSKPGAGDRLSVDDRGIIMVPGVLGGVQLLSVNGEALAPLPGARSSVAAASRYRDGIYLAEAGSGDREVTLVRLDTQGTRLWEVNLKASSRLTVDEIHALGGPGGVVVVTSTDELDRQVTYLDDEGEQREVMGTFLGIDAARIVYTRGPAREIRRYVDGTLQATIEADERVGTPAKVSVRDDGQLLVIGTSDSQPRLSPVTLEGQLAGRPLALSAIGYDDPVSFELAVDPAGGILVAGPSARDSQLTKLREELLFPRPRSR